MRTLLFILLSICCFASAGQQQSLRYQLQKGETYMLRFISEGQSLITLKDKKVLLTSTRETLLELKVVGEKRHRYVFEARYKKVSHILHSDATHKEYVLSNTDSSGKELSAYIIKKLIDRPFSIHMNDLGYIDQIKGIDEMIGTEVADRFKQFPDSVQSMIASDASRSFGNLALKNTLQPYTHIYAPDGTTHWRTASQVTKPSQFNIVMYIGMMETSRLKLVAGGDLFIQEDHYVGAGISEGSKMLGKIRSDIELDVRTGWPSTTFLVQDLAGETTETRSGQATTKFPCRLHCEIKYKVWKVDR
ncbi:hypothetical protein GWC95_16760 [Sediminibacterium roseum]|uniref:Uncharacterized protein n=1 Tax=Sediminibacterium roseum TaxID=1978412 RepID=A0ABW9ZZW4_9BACT|nr:DUF6263 family protein [Sediminibacterium roseum]NCI51583.1 hypothetical protein [Sediminibacterium roseum]